MTTSNLTAVQEKLIFSAIPPEVLARDGGCGNPAKFLKPGEHVLDLGSGSGKTAFIAAQIIGRTGRVIAIDNDSEKLKLSREAQHQFTKTVGFLNIEFRKGQAEDLRMNSEKLERHLAEQTVRTHGDLEKFEEYVRAERAREPLISDNSLDAVLTNNLLSILGPIDRERSLREIHRTLKTSGRAILCEIAASQTVPAAMRKDEGLRLASVAGALEEKAWIAELEKVGFKIIQVLERASQLWRTVNGIEFRAVTFVASNRPHEEISSFKR